MDDKTRTIVVLLLPWLWLVVPLWFLIRSLWRRSKGTPCEQAKGRLHRDGRLTNEEKLEDIYDRIRWHGYTIDKKKVDRLLNPTVDDAVEDERTVIDELDPQANLFASSVVTAETRQEAAERQEREQAMFGTPPKKPGGEAA